MFDKETGETDEPGLADRAVIAGRHARRADDESRHGIGMNGLNFARGKAFRAGLERTGGKAVMQTDTKGARGDYASLKAWTSFWFPIWLECDMVPDFQAELTLTLGGVPHVEVGLQLQHIPSGEFRVWRVPMPIARPNDPQAFGSGMTYGRRYLMHLATGFTDGSLDDDAEAARPKSMTPSDASKLLLEMRGEIDKIRNKKDASPTDLAEWSAKATDRFQKLSDQEQGRLQAYLEAVANKLAGNAE